MGELAKALLVEVGDDPGADGTPIPVQFNPTTLRLQLTSRTKHSGTVGSAASEAIGTSSGTLSMDLVFDSADEGATDRPVSVREKTGLVERYVRPRDRGSEIQPKLRFEWGGLVFVGVVDSVSVDFDHFASDGTPLRAKVSLTIREQDPLYEFLPGSGRSQAPPRPGGIGLGAAGSLSAGFGASANLGLSAGAGLSFGAQAGFALGGETAAEFAARMGLDPGAWRGLDVDLSAGLTLEAGAEVGFDLDLSASPGLGAPAGIEGGSGGSLESSYGIAASPAAGAGGGQAAVAAGERAAGFALAVAGGVGSAVETVNQVRAERAADATRRAFDAPASPSGSSRSGSGSDRPARPEQSRTPMRLSGAPAPARAAAAPAPPPPRADRRATSFGRGVPLRPRRAGPAAGAETPPVRRDPTTPAWEELPRFDRGRKAGDDLQTRRHADLRCSGTARCQCRGHRRGER